MKNKTISGARARIFIWPLSLLLTQASPNTTTAHEVVVHKQITLCAAALLATNSPGYNSILTNISSQSGSLPSYNSYQYRSPIGWMAEGSVREDDAPFLGLIGGDSGGIRSFNHFYNPLNGQGLSDIPPFPLGDDSENLYGRPSIIWAALFNEPGLDTAEPIANKNTQNEWSWQNVRQYEWQGLTNSDPTIRDTHLGRTFRGLGDVVHLLQDASQPQHVRNEQHLDKILGFSSPHRSVIEKYGAEHWQELKYSASVLDWRAAGFTKMRDFWDRDFYTGSAQALNNDASGNPTNKLGLAEFSNGNFIGKTAGYAEYSTPGDKHYFPFPSLETSTDFRSRAYLTANLRVSYLQNGTPIQRIAISKIHDGIAVTNHSILNYIGTKFPRYGGAVTQVSSTINDPVVLQEYLDKLVPKAVEYSAGLLDYFFRGRLAVSNGCVYNVSGPSLSFSGGAFYFYKEATNGVRSLIHTIPLTNVLNSGSSIPITIPETTNSWVSTDKIVAVYKGTIGIGSGGSANDPVDAGIAIAVVRYSVFPNEVGEYYQPLDCFGDFAYHEVPAGMFYSARSADWANYWAWEWALEQYPDLCDL